MNMKPEGRIRRAVRAAFAAIIGKRSNGFVATSAEQQQLASKAAEAADSLIQRVTLPASKTRADVITECVTDLNAINRAADIAAAADHAERWAEREKAARAMLRGIEANDYAWGASFTGTKAALVRAGLLDARNVPTKKKNRSYRLPLNWDDGYKAACFGPTFGKIPQGWQAEAMPSHEGGGLYSVHVQFDTEDLNTRERAEKALAEMDRPDMNVALLRRLMAEIPPVPLSVRLPEAIKAAQKFPKAGK